MLWEKCLSDLSKCACAAAPAHTNPPVMLMVDVEVDVEVLVGVIAAVLIALPDGSECGRPHSDTLISVLFGVVADAGRINTQQNDGELQYRNEMLLPKLLGTR